MPYLAECVLGTLAAVGFICILKGIYDIIITSYIRVEEPATLYLSGDGASPEVERVILAAEQARRAYLPHMRIVFVEQRGDETTESFVSKMAARRGITYIK